MVPARSRPWRDHYQSRYATESSNVSIGYDIDFVASSCDRSLARLVLKQVDEVVSSRNRLLRRQRQAEAFYTLGQRGPQHTNVRSNHLEFPLNLQENDASAAKSKWTPPRPPPPLADDLSSDDSKSDENGTRSDSSEDEAEIHDENIEAVDDSDDDFDSACDDTAIAVAHHNRQLHSVKADVAGGLSKLPSEMNQSVQDCYQSLLQIQENATLKQRKLELEVNYLRKALDDAKAACQELILRKHSDTQDKADETKRKPTDATVEALLNERVRLSDENFVLKEMILKHSCQKCRLEFKALTRSSISSNKDTATLENTSSMQSDSMVMTTAATAVTAVTEAHSISAISHSSDTSSASSPSRSSRQPPTYHQAAQKLVQRITMEALGSVGVRDEHRDGEDDELSAPYAMLSEPASSVRSPSFPNTSKGDNCSQLHPVGVTFEEYSDSSFEESSSPSSSCEASGFACESSHLPDSLLSHADDNFSQSSSKGSDNIPVNAKRIASGSRCTTIEAAPLSTPASRSDKGLPNAGTPDQVLRLADKSQLQADHSTSASNLARLDTDLDTTMIRYDTSKVATDSIVSSKIDAGPSLATFLTQDRRRCETSNNGDEEKRASQSVSLLSTSLSSSTSKYRRACIKTDDITVQNTLEAVERHEKNSKARKLPNIQIDVEGERKEGCKDESNGLLVRIENQNHLTHHPSDRTQRMNHFNGRSFQLPVPQRQEILAEEQEGISVKSSMPMTEPPLNLPRQPIDDQLDHAQHILSTQNAKNDLYNSALVAAMEKRKWKGLVQRHAVSSANTFLAEISHSIQTRSTPGSSVSTDESLYGGALVAAMSQENGKGRKSWKPAAFKSWK